MQIVVTDVGVTVDVCYILDLDCIQFYMSKLTATAATAVVVIVVVAFGIMLKQSHAEDISP